MTSLADIRRSVQPGNVYDVTNHYIKREDHPSFGTNRRTVIRATSARFYLSHERRADGSPIDWPKAAQAQMDLDGTIRLYGGGLGQQPHELFLTLLPVKGAENA